jgi:hypothetical protein
MQGVNIVRSVAVRGVAKDSISVEFTPSGRERIEYLLCELETAIAGAQIVDKRSACGGKGHLRVAWSAS